MKHPLISHQKKNDNINCFKAICGLFVIQSVTYFVMPEVQTSKRKKKKLLTLFISRHEKQQSEGPDLQFAKLAGNLKTQSPVSFSAAGETLTVCAF